MANNRVKEIQRMFDPTTASPQAASPSAGGDSVKPTPKPRRSKSDPKPQAAPRMLNKPVVQVESVDEKKVDQLVDCDATLVSPSEQTSQGHAPLSAVSGERKVAVISPYKCGNVSSHIGQATVVKRTSVVPELSAHCHDRSVGAVNKSPLFVLSEQHDDGSGGGDQLIYETCSIKTEWIESDSSDIDEHNPMVSPPLPPKSTARHSHATGAPPPSLPPKLGHGLHTVPPAASSVPPKKPPPFPPTFDVNGYDSPNLNSVLGNLGAKVPPAIPDTENEYILPSPNPDTQKLSMVYLPMGKVRGGGLQQLSPLESHQQFFEPDAAMTSVSTLTLAGPSEDLDDESLYSQEPLYQIYHDRAVAHEVMSQFCRDRVSSYSSDSHSDDDELIYEDMSVAAGRMQSVIKRMSNGCDIEETDKLSSTISTLIQTCSGSRRLWSDQTRVKNSGILDTLSTSMLKLQECLFEIVASEISYVKSLDILQSHFMKNFKDGCGYHLETSDFQKLFSSITRVASAAHKMHKALASLWHENHILDVGKLCRTVEEISHDNAEVYVRYCCNASFQERKLQELKKKTEFLKTLTELELDSAAHGLTLQSFLMLPMQRVTRMPLLIDAVFRRLDDSSVSTDYCDAERCLETVQMIAKRCNDEARALVSLEQLNTINSSLIFKKVKMIPIVTSGRHLVKEGELIRVNTNEKVMWTVVTKQHDTTTLHFILLNDILLITKKKRDRFDVLTHAPCNRIMAVELNESEIIRRLPCGLPSSCQNLFLLTIMERDKTSDYILACKQSSDMHRWVEAFKTPSSDNESEKIYNDKTDCPQVQALMRFTAAQPDELDLENGDVVNVLRKCSDGWFEGERIRDGKRGWFPVSHTIEIENEHVRMRNLRRQMRLLASSQTEQIERRGGSVFYKAL